MSSRRTLLESLLLSRLPSAFQEVEYLESSGTQYIDTGVIANVNCDVLLDVLYTSQSSGYQGIYQYMSISARPASTTCYVYSNTYIQSTTMLILENVRYTIEFRSSNHSLLVNNNILAATTNPSSSAPTNFYLFACSNATTLRNTSNKLYSCQIYDNLILIRDFVPCYRKADNVAGLYDLVNGIFYTNAGTGTFIVGGNV